MGACASNGGLLILTDYARRGSLHSGRVYFRAVPAPDSLALWLDANAGHYYVRRHRLTCSSRTDQFIGKRTLDGDDELPGVPRSTQKRFTFEAATNAGENCYCSEAQSAFNPSAVAAPLLGAFQILQPLAPEAIRTNLEAIAPSCASLENTMKRIFVRRLLPV